MKINLLFVFVFIATFSLDGFARDCNEVRMGLDIGSGSTKILVAKVDLCQKKILEVLLSESRPVGYNENLDKSLDGKLSADVIEKGLITLKELVDKGKIFKPKNSYGVATSVFRKAKNGASVIKSFAKKLNVRLEVISQETEAMLGYLSAMALVDHKVIDPKNLVVWDIGGGSMQMFAMDESKKPILYLGDLASVTFKNLVIEVLQMKAIDKESSPNPIGEKREQVIALSRAYAKLHVPSTLKVMLKDRTVIGVGGVHGQSIKNQLQIDGKDPKYTLDELGKASRAQSQKSDKELLGDYRTTDVTNLLLVEGFMEALGIREVKVVNASLLQGALLLK